MAILDYAFPANLSSVDAAFGTAATHNSQAGTTLLKSAYASNANAALRYLQFFNALSATGTPVFSFPIPAGTAAVPGSVLVPFTFFGKALFLTGLTWGISTAAGSYVAATAADHIVNITFE